MGQKVNPNGLRLGVNKTWQSTWYADKDYAVKLNNDIKIREYLLKTLSDAAVSSIDIERRKDKSIVIRNRIMKYIIKFY